MSSADPRPSRALEYLLGITGVKTNPEEVDLSSVRATVDMGMGGHAFLHDTAKYQAIEELDNTDLVGNQSVNFPLVSYVSSIGVNQQVVTPPNEHFVLWGISVYLYYTPGALAVHNGNWVGLALRLVQPNGVSCKKWMGVYMVQNGIQLYHDGLHCGSSGGMEKITGRHIGVVPAHCQLSMDIWTQRGENFPAGISVNYEVMGQSVPVGAPLPLNV